MHSVFIDVDKALTFMIMIMIAELLVYCSCFSTALSCRYRLINENDRNCYRLQLTF